MYRNMKQMELSVLSPSRAAFCINDVHNTGVDLIFVTNVVWTGKRERTQHILNWMYGAFHKLSTAHYVGW
jgi:hypothetical protein